MGTHGGLRYIGACALILLAAAFGFPPPATPQADDAAALLAKAAAAFRHNQENEKHWNWNITETRTLVNKAGSPVQKFPSVTSESVIRADGRRCDAVLSWGDGKRPYLRDADPEARCQAMDAVRPPFQIAALLQTTRAKLVERTVNAITLAILPDKSPDKSRPVPPISPSDAPPPSKPRLSLTPSLFSRCIWKAKLPGPAAMPPSHPSSTTRPETADL